MRSTVKMQHGSGRRGREFNPATPIHFCTSSPCCAWGPPGRTARREQEGTGRGLFVRPWSASAGSGTLGGVTEGRGGCGDRVRRRGRVRGGVLGPQGGGTGWARGQRCGGCEVGAAV